MKQKRFAAFGVAAGLLGGGLAGVALGVPGLAGAQEAPSAETTTTTAPAAPAAPAAEPEKGQWARDALKPLVDNGTLTQAQADAVAGALAAARPGRGHGPGGHHGVRGAKLEAAAKALGLSVDELRSALEGGQSLADVAKDKGVDVNKVITALVDGAKAKLADAVAAGRLTQAQADEMTAGLQARIEAFVNGTRPPGGPGGFGGRHGPGGHGPGGRPSSGIIPAPSSAASSNSGSQPA